MSSSASNQVLYPTNPVLLKDVNIPKERGQICILPDGSLLYREPLTETEVPAVRLNDIRPRLVQEAATKRTYRFPKKRGYEDTNVTGFVKKDYNYGPKRENRPDRLFQIQKSEDQKGEEPDGYVMDEGRIVLDGFDHGLRNFGSQLPMYVSSELEGHDIEDYLRRNWQISMYDLVARAPNGYYKGGPETGKKKKNQTSKDKEWHEGPPRVGTFSMRATRFRMGAGCLSWEKKDGTAAKNQRILAVIPGQFKDPAMNSTKGWRDLNKAEIKTIKDGAMSKPQQGPKAKRAAQAKKDEEKKSQNIQKSPIDMIHEGGGDLDNEDESPWIGASNKYDPSVFGPEDFDGSRQFSNANFQSTNPWQSRSAIYETPPNIENAPSQPSLVQPGKRSRGSLDLEPEESTHRRVQKRRKVTGGDQGRDDEGLPRVKKSRTAPQQSKSGRQQIRMLAPNPYATQAASPPMAFPAVDSHTLAQQPLLPLFDGNAESLPTTQGDYSFSHNSGGLVNPGSLLPNAYETNGQYEFNNPVLQSHLVPSPSIGGSESLPTAQEDRGFPPNSGSPVNPEFLFPNTYETNGQYGLNNPVLQSHSAPSVDIGGKRKRTQSSATEVFEARRPVKRAKGHMDQAIQISEARGPYESMPRAENPAPVTGFEIPSSGNWQSNLQNTGSFHTGTNLPEFSSNEFPSPYEKPWNEDIFFHEQGNMPPIDNQQGVLGHAATGPPDFSLYPQTQDPASQHDLAQGVHPPADFDLSEWVEDDQDFSCT